MRVPNLTYRSLFLIILFIIPFLGITQDAVNASGGDATGSGGSSNYSIGQVVYTTTTGGGDVVTQGVQQPYEIFTVDVVEESGVNMELSVYPNPTANYLTLKIGDYKVDKLLYQLYDVSGKLLVKNVITGSETSISMGTYPPSVYFLKIIDTKEIKTFKIIKN